MDTVTVKVPPAFYYDHVTRDLPSGRIVKEAKRYYIIELNQAEYDELLSDATYYAYYISNAGFDNVVGLIASAKATVKALRNAGRPTGATKKVRLGEAL